ncbi:MAG: peptidoglycan DD-metalloendopeptidase family protein [Clostridiales bacterium]|nr:peptidoglycan DD-metalloendopeptidase family protein [Clostridiales bacterium]
MSEVFYNYTYLLGIQFVRIAKRVLKRAGRLAVKPFLAVGAAFVIAFKAIDSFLLKTFHSVFDETRDFIQEIKNTRDILKELKVIDKEHYASHCKYYVRKAFEKHRRVFEYAVNTVLPVIALIILLATIRSFADRTFALEVDYDGKTVGYVANEEVYLSAQNEAVERLDIDEFSQEQTLSRASYTVKPVALNYLNDASTICDRLMESSDSNITNACGIYIDNEFLCAVKNETDAVSVFDKLLEPYQTNEKNTTVGFVENVQYVQGLYPDNESIIWNADVLQNRLNTTKVEAEYYTVKAGDTTSGIADMFDLKTSELYELNPDLGVNDDIYEGQKLLISNQVNYLRVKVTKTEKRTVPVPYNTVEVKNSSLYVGTSRTITEGVEGEQVVTELITYVDGVRTSVKEISRVTTKEKVDKKVEVGTKSRYSYGYGYGSYSTSSDIGSTARYGRFIWPCVGASVVSSPYGWRSRGFHTGVDLCRPGGTYGATIVAADSGTVTSSGWNGSYGYCVTIDHGGGISTLYAHCSQLKVYSGQYVSAGQVIALAGSTGNSTGAHCHFEVRINGSSVNPMPYIN